MSSYLPRGASRETGEALFPGTGKKATGGCGKAAWHPLPATGVFVMLRLSRRKGWKEKDRHGSFAAANPGFKGGRGKTLFPGSPLGSPVFSSGPCKIPTGRKLFSSGCGNFSQGGPEKKSLPFRRGHGPSRSLIRKRLSPFPERDRPGTSFFPSERSKRYDAGRTNRSISQTEGPVPGNVGAAAGNFPPIRLQVGAGGIT